MSCWDLIAGIRQPGNGRPGSSAVYSPCPARHIFRKLEGITSSRPGPDRSQHRHQPAPARPPPPVGLARHGYPCAPTRQKQISPRKKLCLSDLRAFLYFFVNFQGLFHFFSVFWGFFYFFLVVSGGYLGYIVISLCCFFCYILTENEEAGELAL